MNKIEKVMLDSIKKLKGSVLGFGNIDQKILDSINNNADVLEFIILSEETDTVKNQKKSLLKRRKRNNNRISFKKIRKKFRRKNIQTIVASYDDLGKYHRRFVMDSLYLAKNNIYVIIKDEDIDVELIEKRYKRYHQDIELIECRDGFVLKITKTNYKTNKIRDMLYLFIDFIVDGINFIGDLYVS